MIEGVNASLANATVARQVLEQNDVARSYAANPAQVQQVARAPYVSPYIYYNDTYNKAVLAIRDSDSGEIVRQIPSDNQLRAYQKASQVPVPQAKPVETQTVRTEPAPKVAPEAVQAQAPQPQQQNSDVDAQAVASVLVDA
jgi:hypothetical protein